jgi:tetratricopeptide (TPR) repeat protein
LEGLGWAYSATERYAESADAVRRAIEVNPDAAYLHAWLAQAYAELGDLEQADAEQRLLAKLDHQLAADVEKFISEKKQEAGA